MTSAIKSFNVGNMSKMNSIIISKRVLDIGKCEDIVHYSGIQDYLVNDVIIATATSERHCKAIAENIEKIFKENGITFISSTSVSEMGMSNEWVVIDCEVQSLMLHIMTEQQRDYYKIDSLISKMSQQDDMQINSAEIKKPVTVKAPAKTIAKPVVKKAEIKKPVAVKAKK